jgi:hypothetical protein
MCSVMIVIMIIMVVMMIIMIPTAGEDAAAQ